MHRLYIKLQECTGVAINISRAHSQSATLRKLFKVGGALEYLTAKIAEYFPISAKFYDIRARILRQSKVEQVYNHRQKGG